MRFPTIYLTPTDIERAKLSPFKFRVIGDVYVMHIFPTCILIRVPHQKDNLLAGGVFSAVDWWHCTSQFILDSFKIDDS